MIARDQSLHILQHALGLDDYGRGEPYRNHYVTDENGDSWHLLMEHVNAGRMKRHAPREIFGGPCSWCFTVTDAGREYVRANSPPPPRLTRGQERYQRYLSADSELKFGEWLRNEREAARSERVSS